MGNCNADPKSRSRSGHSRKPPTRAVRVDRTQIATAAGLVRVPGDSAWPQFQRPTSSHGVSAHSLDGKFACDNVENVLSSDAVLLDMGCTIMLLRRYWLLISTAAFLLCQVHLALAQGAKVTPLGAQPLPGFSGGEKEGAMFLVEYAPGASSAEHRHDAHVFVYVIEGSVVMQVKGGPERTLKAGDTFYENPDDVHVVSRNASATEPAKFITFFVKTKGAPVVTPVK